MIMIKIMSRAEGMVWRMNINFEPPTSRELSRSADCQSATQQSATLRYEDGGCAGNIQTPAPRGKHQNPNPKPGTGGRRAGARGGNWRKGQCFSKVSPADYRGSAVDQSLPEEGELV